VRGGIPVAAEDSEPVDLHEEVVEPALDRDPPVLLEAEDVEGVATGRSEVVGGDQPRRAVGDVQDGHERQLDESPLDAVRRRNAPAQDICCRDGGRDLLHLTSGPSTRVVALPMILTRTADSHRDLP
jgi:hypothetical protein